VAAKQGRSAISGRFVKQSTVKKDPKTTVNDRGNARGSSDTFHRDRRSVLTLGNRPGAPAHRR
jgi:hypothetical protein